MTLADLGPHFRAITESLLSQSGVGPQESLLTHVWLALHKDKFSVWTASGAVGVFHVKGWGSKTLGMSFEVETQRKQTFGRRVPGTFLGCSGNSGHPNVQFRTTVWTSQTQCSVRAISKTKSCEVVESRGKSCKVALSQGNVSQPQSITQKGVHAREREHWFL